MTRKTLTLTMAGVLCVIVACALSAPKPAAAIDPTLDAALYAIAQATARAQAQQAAQQATRTAAEAIAVQQQAQSLATARALSAQATAQAFAVQTTATAVSAQATQSALDELQRQRSMTATADRAAIVATSTALAQSAKATATAEALNAQATRETYQTQATAQAALWAEQATAIAHQNETAATRQERFSLGLLVIELGMVAGALWVLWRLSGTLAAWAVKMRPQTEPAFAGILASATAQSSAGSVVIEQEPEPAPRMPDFVQVVDNPDMVAALDRWAERYDKEHGVTYGNS